METISVAYILNQNNQILVLKRSNKKNSNPGKWHVLSGKIENGENEIECIKREAQEELGLEFSFTQIRRAEYLDVQNDGQWKTHLFVMRYSGGKIVLNSENSKYQWVSKNDLLYMDIIPSIIEDLKHIVV